MRALICLFLLTGPALADDQVLDQATLDEAEGLFFDGLTSYRAGQFEKAAIGFQKAYALTKHRDLLFNVARSRERLGDKEGAVSWYQAYLATTPADETAIIHRIRQLGGDPTARPKAPRREVPEAVVEAPPPTGSSGAGPWPWVAAGVGLAAAGVGTWLGLSALDDAAAARDERDRAKAIDLKDSAESNALFADIAFAAGAVAVASAVFLWVRADGRAETDGAIELGATADGMHVGWSTRF